MKQKNQIIFAVLTILACQWAQATSCAVLTEEKPNEYTQLLVKKEVKEGYQILHTQGDLIMSVDKKDTKISVYIYNPSPYGTD